MGKARNLADLLDDNGDVKSASLDNVPASNNASALTTGTLPMARLSGTLPALNASALTAIPAANITGTLPAISGASLTNLPSDVTVSASAPGSPSAGDLWFDSTTGAKILKVYNGTGWDQLSNKFSATGGSVTTYSSGGNSYTVHTFTSSATFIAAENGTIDILMIGGGGAGGGVNDGGGGAGGMIVATNYNVDAGDYSLVIGAGGAAMPGHPQGAATSSGSNTTGFSMIAKGGGGGSYHGHHDGYDGGSGGGGGHSPNPNGGSSTQANYSYSGATINTYGNDGGDSGYDNPYLGAGGGGAGAAGGNAVQNSRAGHGGAGRANNFRTGSNITYAGGGGGGTQNGGSAGNGGSGGGGSGTTTSTKAGDGTVNTGSGGGGAGYNGGTSAIISGGGGSGIVIIRYLT